MRRAASAAAARNERVDDQKLPTASSGRRRGVSDNERRKHNNARTNQGRRSQPARGVGARRRVTRIDCRRDTLHASLVVVVGIVGVGVVGVCTLDFSTGVAVVVVVCRANLCDSFVSSQYHRHQSLRLVLFVFVSPRRRVLDFSRPTAAAAAQRRGGVCDVGGRCDARRGRGGC